MAIKLSELINKHGDEKIKFQLLDTSIVSMQKKRKHNEFTFATDQGFGLETNQIGIIVWLDRDKVSEILQANKEEKQ